MFAVTSIQYTVISIKQYITLFYNITDVINIQGEQQRTKNRSLGDPAVIGSLVDSLPLNKVACVRVK